MAEKPQKPKAKPAYTPAIKKPGKPKAAPKPAPAPAAKSEGGPEAERIAKRMARAGLCSRREAETWIEQGRVSVNGKKITSPALNVTEADVITVDGAPIAAKEPARLWLYYKPPGLVTTHKDPQGRPTVFSALPKAMPRVISVGRLDLNSEGLLLLTNDGAISRQLELPENAWIRRYRVRGFGTFPEGAMEAMREGVVIAGVHYGSIEITLETHTGRNRWYSVSLREGKNREIRKVFEHFGLQVGRLIRTHYGPFQLAGLEPGQVREVQKKALKASIKGYA